MTFDSPLFKLPNTFRPFYGSFSGLHPAQIQAIDPILDGRDLILQAATGSGKSQAVLAPCMERIIQSSTQPGSHYGTQSGRDFAIIYIIPTRALAVDLVRRFEPVISDRLGLNLAIRTGDLKRTGGKRPDIMFTTPESLDVMMGSGNEALKAFLSRVGCVIIDEVHPLIYNYRGVHLALLLTRLERRNGRTIQRIAMSATIASVEDLIDAFNFKPLPETCHIQTSVSRGIIARLIHLKKEVVEFPALLNDLHDTWNYRKILLFANSRGACDRLFGIINRTGRFKGVSELHYSNLKPRERKEAEKRFRKNSHALCIATSTLELGIDVGDVDAVLLYEPPDSVSAFLQRIGRSNRREKSVNFWGICQGEHASRQVVRFLALLNLARQGVVESVPRRTLPSVMAQQIISCLYEKKQISIPAILDLFQSRTEALSNGSSSYSAGSFMTDLFHSLEKKRWIKKSLVSGIYSGGFQYGKHLTEYRIWGNFPETEEEYTLELMMNSSSCRNHLTDAATSQQIPDSSRSIADIPRSIVNQMEVGQRVHIVGRRLKILKIDHDDQKRVFATPTTARPDKDIIWIGMGAHVSFEVAQMMRTILKSSTASDDPALLSRTTTLLKSELEKEKNIALLDNGIEVLPGSKASYLYRTYIGSVGNLVLEWCIKTYIEKEKQSCNYTGRDDNSNEILGNANSTLVTSHEIGVECSCLIRFENLNLPQNRIAFQRWVKGNIKILGSLIPLNLFCKTLPNDLLAEEVTDFLFDQRVIDIFNHYLEHTSEVIDGEINVVQACALIEQGSDNGIDEVTNIYKSRTNSEQSDSPHILDLNIGVSLLELEKQKWLPKNIPGLSQERTTLDRTASDRTTSNKTENKIAPLFSSCLTLNPSGTVTATMVSDYFMHDQCRRRFCFKFLRMESPDSQLSTKETPLREAVMKQGIIHEKSVLDALKREGEHIIHMPDPANRSSTERFQDFLDLTTRLLSDFTMSRNTMPMPESTPIPESTLNSSFPVPSSFHIYQCLLKLDSITEDNLDINALGIPDLIVVSVNGNGRQQQIVMEVGDIKSSRTPRYHHKWQVAFYALLLQKIIALYEIPAIVSSKGFLMIRPYSFKNSDKEAPYEKHSFDLTPFMTAFPMLVETLQATLSHPPSAADHRLEPHCTSCEWFVRCYEDALEKEDIQFLHGLTRGELVKLRKMGLAMIENVHAHFQKHADFQDRASIALQNLKSNTPEFSSGERNRLICRCDAILKNRIHIYKEKTRLFPANLSALFFVHLVKDPVSQSPSALGWRVMDDNFKVIENHIQSIENENGQKEAWFQFAECLSKTWNSHSFREKGPHIFYFGSQTRNSILEWGELALNNSDRDSTSNRDKDIVRVAGDASLLWQKQPSVWSDIKKIFTEHFYMPSPGSMSLFTIAHIFGCNQGIEQPESLFHTYDDSQLEPQLDSILTTMAELLKRVKPLLESQWIQEWKRDSSSKSAFMQFIGEERRLKEENIIDLQELSLHERMEKFRSIGYLRFRHTRMDHNRRTLYVFNITDQTMPSKFRKGDFMKLTPHGMSDLQNGSSVIISEYDMEAGELALLSRSGGLNLSQTIFYSLEEDTADFTEAKLSHAAEFLFSESPFHPANQLLTGMWEQRQERESVRWIEKWIKTSDVGLNSSQQAALALPFQYKTSMIQGPPGTGKSHLLAWILILLVMEAFERGLPLRIGVSALTHQAIDNVLEKVVSLVNQLEPEIFSGQPFPASCIKWGKEANGEKKAVEYSDDADEVLSRTWAIIGATGFGFYNLFNSRNGEFPEALDWIIFDEASQVLLPQALLTLVYGKGNFLFLGDVHQLPPIVMGDYGDDLNSSILSRLMALYPESHHVTLDITYRMNREICSFPSKMWYQGRLYPAPANADSRLQLNCPIKSSGHLASFTEHIDNSDHTDDLKQFFNSVLDPLKPVVMLLVEHEGASQQCDVEAKLMAELAHELMVRGLKAEQIALISPHRAQNNAIIKKLGDMIADKAGKEGAATKHMAEPTAKKDDQGWQRSDKAKLSLPLVDTVERVQGAERDVIIFGITSSDPDHVLSDFLNSPNRLNVAITRARDKLIIIGSRAFFYAIPDNEVMLEKNRCFKALLEHCRGQDALFMV